MPLNRNKPISTADILSRYRKATGTGPSVSSIIARMNQERRNAEIQSAKLNRNLISAGKTGIKADTAFREYNTAKMAPGHENLKFMDFLRNPELYSDAGQKGAEMLLESGKRPQGLIGSLFKSKVGGVIGETANKAASKIGGAVGGISDAMNMFKKPDVGNVAGTASSVATLAGASNPVTLPLSIISWLYKLSKGL